MTDSEWTAGRPAADALAALRREWLGVAAVWAAVWLLFYAALRPAWPDSSRWLALSGVALAYGLWVVWRHLPDNRSLDDGRPRPRLGPGNHLTLVRGLCIGLLAGFLFGPWPAGALAWVIVLLYTLVDVADFLDGYVARRASHVTRLGGALDMEFDALGTLVVILLAVSFGQLPWWYVGLGLARYLFVFGLWARRRLGRPIHDIPPSAHRRLIAGLQMGFLSVVLWPILPATMATIAGTIYGAATAASFLRDWLVTTGRLDPGGDGYRRVQRAIYRAAAVWLPPVLRAGLVAGVASLLRQSVPPLPPVAWTALLTSWGVPLPAVGAALVGLLAVAATAAVAFGLLGRFAAVALTLPIGFDMTVRGLQWDNGLALACAVGVQLLGTGPLSLWRPEDRLLLTRLGGR